MKKDKTVEIFKKIIFVCFFIIMATFIFFTNYRASLDTPDRFFSEKSIKDNDVKSSDLIELKILPGTKIYYHDYYDLCDHDLMYERPQGSNGLVSFSKSQIESLFPTYTVEEFTTTKVVLKRFVEGRCFDCKNFAFIGEKDGFVAIFYGKARQNADLKYLTDIPVDKFTEEQQEIIKAGITVQNSQEEINTILEGLNS